MQQGSHVWVTPKSDPDIIARNLIAVAQLGRNMPPAWDGAEISHMYGGPGGELVGRILPGKGLYLDVDLKGYGITKQLPNVYERSATQWLVDLLKGNERGAISTYDGIINARCSAGKADDVVIGKVSFASLGSAWSSMYQAAGMPPAGTYTAIPGGAAHTRASTGAWSLGLSNPVNPDKKYLLTLGFTSASQINLAILVDLLVCCGNISCNSGSSPYTINSTALTRYTSGAGVQMTFDVTTVLSGTADNLTVSAYHNQAGAASHATGALVLTTSAIVQRLLPIALGPYIQLQSGDYGVQSVETITMSGANTGVLALNLYFPLMFVQNVAANNYVERDSTLQIDGITELVQTAGGVIGCLNAYIWTNASTSGIFSAFMRTAAG